MIGLAGGGPEDEPSAKCSPLRRLPAADKGSKKVTVLLAKSQSWSSFPHAVSIAGLSLIVTLYMIHNTSFKLQEIRDRFSTPEEINDSPQTRPSARIFNLFPSYRKRIHGPITSIRIGLETMRQECSHFNEWCIKLEKIGSQ
jgi:hypothetical protein